MHLKINQKRLYAWYLKERRILVLSAVFGLLFTVLSAFAAAHYSETVQAGIAAEVVRFHVLANSDSPADQALKLKVRDGILAEFQPLLTAAQSADETKAALGARLGEITACAERIIKENGAAYPVAARVTKSVFPTKTYGDVVLPAGEYDALRVEIGEAVGQNWWCVMFPPLCFVDIAQGKVTEEAKAGLETILPEEAYDLVANAATTDNPEIQLKFKIVEWWQELKTAEKK
ncbi:MAG: stage II sporulation protein R [Clostridiales bacterium]|nr:stage II sporulation protein R [Clostridiales bacterium]